LVEEAKSKLQENKQHPLCVPNANFYVRIPKAKDKKDKQQSKKGQKKESEPNPAAEQDDGGEWSTAGEKKPPTAPKHSPTSLSHPSQSPTPTSGAKRVINAVVAEFEGGITMGNATELINRTTLGKARVRKMKITKPSAHTAFEQIREPIATSPTPFDLLDDEELVD
jgi:hypothetical protein